MNIKSIFLFTLIVGVANAQMKQSTFVFGPKVGVQANKLNLVKAADATEAKLNMQYQGGIFTRLNLGIFSLQPEFVYQIKGGTLTEPSEKHTYRYISTPVLLGISPFKGFHLVAGPEYSWAINQGWKKEGITQFGPDLKNDKALVMGARIDLLDAFSMFSVNLRYVHGLQNTTARTVDSSPADYRTRSFQISATYNFSEYYKWYRKYGLKKKK